jgi:DNA-binding MarR family transcriptional regulator
MEVLIMSANNLNALNASLIHLLHRAGQAADEKFTAEIGNSDLTPRQFAVLSALAMQELASQTEIVETTGIDRSTLADIVRRLVKRGLLARRRARQDARAYTVRLTQTGQSALKTAAPAAERAGERILRPLPPARRAELMAGLALLVESLKSEQPPDAALATAIRR